MTRTKLSRTAFALAACCSSALLIGSAAHAANFSAEYVFGDSLSDVGNVYHESQSIDFTRLRTAVGAELRIFLPIFQAPLRFIYSFNLDPKTPIDQFGFPINSLKERRSGFDFSIGRTF